MSGVIHRLFGRSRDRAAAMLGKRDRYRRVFSTPDGEAVLSDILRYCGAGADAFVPGDPTHTTYNVGKQAAAARIIRIMRLTDDAVCRLIEDQHAITEDMEGEHNG